MRGIKTLQNSAILKLRKDLQHTRNYYIHQADQTYVLIKESRHHLERMDTKNSPIKMRILLNMGLMYCYALYEAFTRDYFRKILKHELNMSKKEFNTQYQRFHDIRLKMIKGRYNIRLPKDMFNVLKLLHDARNGIGYEGKKGLQEFDIIICCFTTIIEYFKYISFRMAKRLK